METPNGPWAHAFVRTPTGHQIHYVHAGPVDGLPIVLVHGWPDLWFGWRNQIKALGSIYRVIVPDLRGFGQSSCPREVSAYGGKNITNDLLALLDAIKIDKAVFIGHDWGGHMVWRMCLYHPQRVLAVCSVCTPYIPPRDVYIDLDTVIKITPSFAYQKFLSDPANAASYLDTSPRRLFTMLYRRYYEVLPPEERIPFPDMLKGVKDSSLSIYTKPSTLLTSKEMEYYIQQYTKTGFQTGLNFYATHKIDYENELGLSRILTMPALYIGAQYDAVLKPDMAKKMPQFIPNLTMKIVKEAGHWILCEQPVQVNTHLLEWLESINSKVKGKQAKL